MTSEELRSEINRILSNEPISAELYLVFKEDGQYTLRLANVEDKNTEPALRELFVDAIQKLIIQDKEWELRELSDADERDHVIYHYDDECYPGISWLKQFNIKDAVKETEKLNPSKDARNHLFGYLVYIGTMEHGIVLFKKYYPVLLLKQASILFFWGSQQLKKVSEDMLRLNGDFQLFQLCGELYVRDVEVLEKHMGYATRLQKSAAQAVQVIADMGIVENVDILKDGMNEPSFVRKLARVLKSSPVLQKNIPPERIIAFIDSTPGLAGTIAYSDDRKKISLRSKKSRDVFLKVLNDDFLKSQLSQEFYEAKAKNKLDM